MRLLALPISLSLLALTTALTIPQAQAPLQQLEPQPQPQREQPASHLSSSSSPPLPLLIWHGLGDRFDAEGLHSIGSLAASVHPGTPIHYIRVADDGATDRTDSFFGNLTTQLTDVCAQIHNSSELQNAASTHHNAAGQRVIRADALGFSQGGQFLRGLAQRCDGLEVRSLVTFGSQHSGINEFQTCGTWDLVCKAATALVKGNAWTDTVQGKVVPAQYYRELNSTTSRPVEGYLRHSGFLADVNNERVVKNVTYADRMAALEAFVMFVFEDDTTVLPKESGWFADVDLRDGRVWGLRERRLYLEDWLGLRRLDEKGGLVFRTAPGGHMDLEEDVLREVFGEFFGPERRK
ncbi:hypothetical protein MBLNU230_g5105t1 [Neophaeotheca triangularis]